MPATSTIPFVLPFEIGHFPDRVVLRAKRPALARSAIGLDNDLTNPLQMALIASAIANRRHDVCSRGS